MRVLRYLPQAPQILQRLGSPSLPSLVQGGWAVCALEVVLLCGVGVVFGGCEGGGWGFLGAIVIVFLGFSIVFSFLIRFFPLYYW